MTEVQEEACEASMEQREGIVNLARKQKSFFEEKRKGRGEKRRIERNGSLLGSRLSSGHLVPNQETILHESTVILCSETMPFGPKVIQNRPECGEKLLGLDCLI
ncbi:hypothetical protein KSC_109700 [Ktedonobacter sp. SOSP1-52]|nr:hypothetical protein KSC_109700 [Ktedonobacter sp. SOSP1-52]